MNERSRQSCQNKVRTAEDSNEAFGQTAPADPGPSAINVCSSSELGGRLAAAPARSVAGIDVVEYKPSRKKTRRQSVWVFHYCTIPSSVAWCGVTKQQKNPFTRQKL